MMLTLLDAVRNKHISDFAYGHAYIRACMRGDNDIVCEKYQYVHIAARSIRLFTEKHINDPRARGSPVETNGYYVFRFRAVENKPSYFLEILDRGEGIPDVALSIGSAHGLIARGWGD